MMNTQTISTELLDDMVDALTRLPFRDVQPLFQRLAIELGPAQEKQEEPQIIHPH